MSPIGVVRSTTAKMRGSLGKGHSTTISAPLTVCLRYVLFKNINQLISDHK